MLVQAVFAKLSVLAFPLVVAALYIFPPSFVYVFS